MPDLDASFFEDAPAAAEPVAPDGGFNEAFWEAAELAGKDAAAFEDFPRPFVFTSCALLGFDSVEVVGPAQLRARFTRAVAAGTAANFAITGAPAPPAIALATRNSADPRVFDLYLAAALPAGEYTVTATGLLSVESYRLKTPYTQPLTYRPTDQERISRGATNTPTVD